MSDYPDFTITALLKGLYAGDPKALAVDAVGNIIAMLKAEYAGSPINLEADSAGNLSINLKAQELSEIINRFKYGAPDLDGIDQAVAAGNEATVYTLAGKGQIYTAYIHVFSTVSQKNDLISVYLDGQRITTKNYLTLQIYNMYDYTTYPMALIEYDEINFTYTVIMCVGYTFESAVEIKYDNKSAVQVAVYGEDIYSVI